MMYHVLITHRSDLFRAYVLPSLSRLTLVVAVSIMLPHTRPTGQRMAA